MFARGASPEQVMEAFGMVPGAAQLLPADPEDIFESLPYPMDDTFPPVHPWIRVGKEGEWAFAIDESAGGDGGYAEDAPLVAAAGPRGGRGSPRPPHRPLPLHASRNEASPVALA